MWDVKLDSAEGCGKAAHGPASMCNQCKHQVSTIGNLRSVRVAGDVAAGGAARQVLQRLLAVAQHHRDCLLRRLLNRLNLKAESISTLEQD